MASTNSRTLSCSSPLSEGGSDYDMADLYRNNGGNESGESNKDTQRRTSWMSRVAAVTGFGGKASTSDDNTNEDDEEKDDAVDKKEDRVVRIIRGIRNKLIARGLVGKIMIEQGGGISTRGVEVAVTDEDKLDIDYVENDSEIKRTFGMTDNCISNLEKRCKKWDGCAFIPNVTLKRGYSLTFSSPFISVLSWSMEINIEVTLTSLLEARKRREQNKTRDSLAMGGAQIDENGSRTSVFRRQLFESSDGYRSNGHSSHGDNQQRRRSSLN